MDRINAANWVDIGGGRRGFRNQNKLAGLPGTVLASVWLNNVQEELLKVIQEAGIVPDEADSTQLLQALLFHRGALNITVPTTITIGSDPDDDHATLASALDWLRQRRILPGATVTLAFRAEQHVTHAALVTIDHPDGKRIRLQGAAMLGSDPAPADFTVTGSNTGARAADATANIAMLRSRYATELRFTGGASLTIDGNVGYIDDLLITGDGSNVRGVVGRNGNIGIGTVSIHGFGNDNLSFRTGAVSIDHVLTGSGGGGDALEFSDCSVVAFGAKVLGYGSLIGVEFVRNVEASIDQLIGRGNLGTNVVVNNMSAVLCNTATGSNGGNVGVAVSYGAALVALTSATSSGNGAFGVSVGVNSLFHTPAWTSSGNTGSGMACSSGSFASVPNGSTTGNGGAGISASFGGFVDASGVTSTGNSGGSYSPVVNTLGNSNAFIARP